MKDRLKEIIAYKTGGRQTDFCNLVGWNPPYLSKLLRGEDFGIKPIITLLRAFPDIDARWLLLGTGSMLTDAKFAAVRRSLFDNASSLFDLEKYLPVMTPEELRTFEALVTGGGKPTFSPDVVAAWGQRLADRDKEMQQRLTDAMFKSKDTKRCRQKTAKP